MPFGIILRTMCMPEALRFLIRVMRDNQVPDPTTQANIVPEADGLRDLSEDAKDISSPST
jgi:hypothetical protein